MQVKFRQSKQVLLSHDTKLYISPGLEITIVESKKTEIEIPKKVEVEEIKKEEPVEKKLDIDLKEVDLEENNSTSAQSTS